MIRINLLAVERERTKKKGTFQIGQKITIGCSLILVLTGLFIAWRYWNVTRDSKAVDAKIVAGQQETGRLQSIIQQVQQYEQRRAQLQQRVTLIEQLRKGQTGPVHMLDQVSRALPPMVWLVQLKQGGAGAKMPGVAASPDDVTIEGRCTSMTSLTDFVQNLEASGYFKRSIEILSSSTETLPQPPGELIRFTIKAVFQPPAEAAPAAARPGG